MIDNQIVFLCSMAMVISELAIVQFLTLSAWRQNLNAQLHSMAINNVLKKLLTEIQQHRGMVSAYLSGDKTFSHKISQLQITINKRIPEIIDLLQHSSQDQHSQEFVLINQSWSKLHPLVLNHLSKQESFEQHCALIVNILNLIRDISEKSQLHQYGICPYSVVEILWHLLLDASEAVGQARAIGSGVAAAGCCQVIERIKLGFLVTRIRDAMKRADTGIDNAQIDVITSDFRNKGRRILHTNIEDFIRLIEHKLLLPDKPQVDSTSYFNQATETLTEIFELFDNGEASTRQCLQQRISTISKKRTHYLIVNLGVLIFMTFLIWNNTQ